MKVAAVIINSISSVNSSLVLTPKHVSLDFFERSAWESPTYFLVFYTYVKNYNNYKLYKAFKAKK